MSQDYFEVLADSPDRGLFRSSEWTVGPWSPAHQHGGPPNALAVARAERLAVAETQRDDLVAVRLASEFIGPLPVADIETRARLVRAARGAVLVEVVLSSDDRDCLHSRVWMVRDTDTGALRSAASPAAAVPASAPGLDAEFPHGRSIEWRFVHGSFQRPGPAASWARPRVALLDGHRYGGLQFAALLGDSASGISAELDWARWSFLNVDLDIHLARPVTGEWLLLDAVTQLGDHGSALARSTVSDERGPVGATMQTLVVAPLRH